MEYIIAELENKVRQLKSDKSGRLLQEIESLLRDIKNQEGVPPHLKVKLASVINQIGEDYDRNTASNIPYLVLAVIDKIKTPSNAKATAGQTAVEGQNIMRRDTNDSLSASKIMSKLNFRLWR